MHLKTIFIKKNNFHLYKTLYFTALYSQSLKETDHKIYFPYSDNKIECSLVCIKYIFFLKSDRFNYYEMTLQQEKLIPISLLMFSCIMFDKLDLSL